MKWRPIVVAGAPEHEEGLHGGREELENLIYVRFISFEHAVQSCPVVLVQFEIEVVEAWNAGIHSLDHFVLEVEKSGVVEWDSDVAGEGWGLVVSHGTEM
jgi:hypothetical protein